MRNLSELPEALPVVRYCPFWLLIILLEKIVKDKPAVKELPADAYLLAQKSACLSDFIKLVSDCTAVAPTKAPLPVFFLKPLQ